MQPVEHLPLLRSIKLSWLAPRPDPQAEATAQAAFSQLLGCNRASPGGANARQTSQVFSGEGASVREQPHPGVGETGSRPSAPKTSASPSAYVFGAVCPSQGKRRH